MIIPRWIMISDIKDQLFIRNLEFEEAASCVDLSKDSVAKREFKSERAMRASFSFRTYSLSLLRMRECVRDARKR